MNEAIKLAIEKGGYDHKQMKFTAGSLFWFGEHKPEKDIQNEMALDPLFWQALGKALGWKERTKTIHYQTWYLYAKEYFHLLLTGGDTEQFFKDLLKTK